MSTSIIIIFLVVFILIFRRFDGRYRKWRGIFQVQFVAASDIVNQRIENVSDVFHGGHIQNRQRIRVFGVMRSHKGQSITEEITTT